MSPRMQIIKEENTLTLVGDFHEEGMPLSEAKEYFLNWMESYPQAVDDNYSFYFEDKAGNKTELKLQ
ncbi:hypothetical protein A9Q84_11030 [Halobacteriovorax marinus]|uniref:Uncharacterized protein n=1 Tax=Halobacteriovorax marinus TaxID=97084 RepID=A0A1Y5FE34_9BACT|nr:hypothetical protein A9Q84_11030 [Halobacteriovorax marinus]